MRDTASEELRSLLTYDSDNSDMPESRDAIFVAVLRGIVCEAITAEYNSNNNNGNNNGKNNNGFDLQGLQENLLAVVVLEETIGTREPRNSCREGLLLLLFLLLLSLLLLFWFII